jgi:hypothetical protein
MIYKIPEQKDEFKESIEQAKKEIEKDSYIHREEQDIPKLMLEHLPKSQDSLNDKITDIVSLLTNTNPLHILNYFAMAYTFTNKILEDKDSLSNVYMDYILSLVISLKSYDFDIYLEEDELEKVKKQIEDLHQEVIFHLMIVSVDEDKQPDKMKFLQSMSYFITRGDSYTQHKIDLCKELYGKYDDILFKTYGLNSNCIIDELVKIANEPAYNINIYMDYMKIMKESHKVFIKFCDIEESKDNVDVHILEKYKDSNESKALHKQIQDIYDKTGFAFNDSLFKIKNTTLPNKILEQITSTIGDNQIFEKGEIKYLPTNYSIIYDKPLLQIDDDYYCFNLQLILYNLHMIMENITLQLIPVNKRSKIYNSKKGVYLEDKSLEYFQKLLPTAKIYKNLKYNQDDEVDGIVIYDNNIFIVEAKSNKFTLDAKKGSLSRIKKNTSDIIDKAYQQAIRAKKYILSNSTIEFRDNKKNIVLTIDDTSNKNIFMINTTLEPLGNITTNLNSLKRFGFIEGKDWIWSVYINDLRIIAEIIESPTEFLVYLERRIRLNDYEQIHMMEEIDIFGFFLHNGLYFDDIDFPKENYMMNLVGFTESIDKYFLSQENTKIHKDSKPSYFMKCSTNKIISSIELSTKDNFSVLSKFILSYDGINQDEIIKQIVNILQGTRRNFSMSNMDENIGFTVVNKNYKNLKDMEFYCKVISYETKINNWFLIYVDGSSLSNLQIDFDLLYFENNHNKTLEIEVKELHERRLKQALEFKKKIGRNELCPCGSGKKYKRCCINN